MILRKEAHMRYTKPEVSVLGNARSVIELISQKTNSATDPNEPVPNSDGSAYDLDE